MCGGVPRARAATRQTRSPEAKPPLALTAKHGTPTAGCVISQTGDRLDQHPPPRRARNDPRFSLAENPDHATAVTKAVKALARFGARRGTVAGSLSRGIHRSTSTSVETIGMTDSRHMTHLRHSLVGP